MKILLVDDEPSRGFCSRLDDDRIIHLDFFSSFDEEESKEEEPRAGTKAPTPLLLIEVIILAAARGIISPRERQEQEQQLKIPFCGVRSFRFFPKGVVL